MMSVLTILFLVFQSAPILSGTVTDENNEALPGVHLYWSDGSGGTTSDLNGNFRLRIPENERPELIVSMIGFQRLSIRFSSIDDFDSFSITLEPITLRSGDVIVTAGRYSQLQGSVAMSITTVNTAEIEQRNAVSLDEVLRYIPGVQMAQNQVNIRGSTGFSYGTGSRVLLLIDGVPMMGPDQNDIKFDALPMSQVERIEVIKGPGSALYGSGALGGVINLITKTYPTQPETRVRGFTGFYEPVPFERWKREWDGASSARPYSGVSFSHAQTLTNRVGFWISGLYKNDTGYLENTNQQSLQVYGKTGIRTSDNTRLDLYMGYRFNKNRQFLYWNGLNDPLRAGRIILGGGVAAGTNYVQTEHYSFLPSFFHLVNDQFFYHLRGRAYGIAVKPIDSEGNIRPRDQHTYGFRYGAETQTTWLPISGLQIISGISYDDIMADSEFFIGTDNQMVRNQPEYAVFSQFDYTINRHFSLSGGLRYDAYQIDTQDIASKLSPKLNLSWFPVESVSARLAYGQGFRVPAVSERFVNNRDFLPLEPNLDLRPEESTGYEVGVGYTRRLSQSWDFNSDVAVFRNEYKNLVEPVFNPELGAFQFINLTEAVINGIELTAGISSRNNGHRLDVNYVYLNHSDSDTDEPLVYRSDHQFKVSLLADLPFNLQLGTDYRYLSKPARLDSDFSIFVPNADAFTDIHVLDMRLIAEIPVSSFVEITTFAQVRNLLRHFYVERPAYLAETRTWEFGLQMKF